MATDISKRIRNIYPSLSKGHKRLANIVLREPEKAKDYPCSRLAIAGEVSESTVLRFVKNIGYDSYSKFKDAILSEFQSRMDYSDKVVTATEGVMRADLMKRTLNMDVANIKYKIEHVDPSTFNAVVDLTIKSKRKFIVAFGNDALPAKLLFDNFVTIFENVSFITSNDDYFAHLLSLTKHDQVIIFSISDKSKALRGLTHFIKSKGTSIVLISNNKSAPLAEFADHILVAKSDTPSFSESFATTFGLINSLTLEIVRKDRVRVAARYKQIQQLRANFEK